MGLPEQDHIPGEWHQWRGKTDAKLDAMDSKITVVDKKVDRNSETLSKMPDEIEKRVQKVVNGSSQAKPPGNGQPVTFKWVAEKVLLPVVILVASLIIAAAFASG
jgi:hypothetical protein